MPTTTDFGIIGYAIFEGYIVLCVLNPFPDTIYWNFCPSFFNKQDIKTKIEGTTHDPHKNTHFMENYYDTREQWLVLGFLSIRSKGSRQVTLAFQ